MDFNSDLNTDFDALGELDDLMGELKSDLSDRTVQMDAEIKRASAEGFACLFPDWDLKPVRRQ